MSTESADIRVGCDVANPGHFFACGGLFELADRLWGEARAWFDLAALQFCIEFKNAADDPARELLTAIGGCNLHNTMSAEQLQRRSALKAKPKREQSKAEAAEKKELEKLWRERPLTLGPPFTPPLRLDWFLDSRAGGSRFKTWAGQQSVIDIAQSMKRPIEEGAYDEVPTAQWLRFACGHGVSFNFNADEGAQSSAIDVGFVLDPLQMSSQTQPLLEFLAFVGLQRFRPESDTKANRYTYATWSEPLLLQAAAVVATGCVSTPGSGRFAFPLLYRTKYLKSFLPAQPV